MSYILDALKKSEKQRQQDHSTSTIHAAQPTPPKPVREGGRKRLWILPAILLTTGLIGYSISSKTSPSDSPAPPAEISPSAPPTHQKKTPPAVEQIDTVEEAPSIPELHPSGKKVSHQNKVSEGIATPATAGAKPTEPAAVDGQPPNTSQKVPLLEELDPALRESIPAFRLAGHVYSPDPQLRMILINHSVVRENDIIEKGYVLEEITVHGVVLRKGDVRFRLQVD